MIILPVALPDPQEDLSQNLNIPHNHEEFDNLKITISGFLPVNNSSGFWSKQAELNCNSSGSRVSPDFRVIICPGTSVFSQV